MFFQYAEELERQTQLRTSMFRDRATQFSERLGWDVNVNDSGEEVDEYDSLNPLYVIVTHPDGSHAGSLRFLPTTGRTMVNEHFLHLTDEVDIRSPRIWECTRFCISPRAGRRTAAKLLAAGGKLMKEYQIDHFVGVFDARMERVYQRIGSSPTVLGRSMIGDEAICVGLWEYSELSYRALIRNAGISEFDMDLCFVNGPPSQAELELAG